MTLVVLPVEEDGIPNASSHRDSFCAWGGRERTGGCRLPAFPSPFTHFFAFLQAAPIGSELREAKGIGASFKIRPVRSPYLQLGFIRRAGRPYPIL